MTLLVLVLVLVVHLMVLVASSMLQLVTFKRSTLDLNHSTHWPLVVWSG